MTERNDKEDYRQRLVMSEDAVAFWRQAAGAERKEVERLRENIDIWQETAEDALDRLRAASEGKGKSFDPEGLSRGRSEE